MMGKWNAITFPSFKRNKAKRSDVQKRQNNGLPAFDKFKKIVSINKWNAILMFMGFLLGKATILGVQE